MMQHRQRTLWIICLVAIWMTTATLAGGVTLSVKVALKVAGESIQPASLRYETSARENFSITRVSYLLSDLAFQRADGSWL